MLPSDISIKTRKAKLKRSSWLKNLMMIVALTFEKKQQICETSTEKQNSLNYLLFGEGITVTCLILKAFQNWLLEVGKIQPYLPRTIQQITLISRI
jgi:hypothetical protein